MKKSIADWLWRVALLAALVWIGLSLHQIHQDMLQPADDGQDVAAAPSDPNSADPEDGDDVHQQLALLNQKLDAIMIAMVQLRR